MKKLCLTLLALSILFQTHVYAQWSGTNPISTSSKVVIGSATASDAQLGIDGNGDWHLRLKDALGSDWRIGSTGSNWVVGGGKLVFTPTSLSTASVLTLIPTGKVGINNPSPAAVLDFSPVASGTLSTVFGRISDGNTSGSGTFLGVTVLDAASANVKSFSLEHAYSGYVNNSIAFYRGGTQTGGFMTFSTNDNTERMRIASNGNVSIGTVYNNGYKLAVDGVIGAREVNVNSLGWSDYVFNDDYKLLPLTEVEGFISKNHHLPEIPSARDVEANGVNVGEMNALLLKKIEELTLYVIDQEKRIKQLESQR